METCQSNNQNRFRGKRRIPESLVLQVCPRQKMLHTMIREGQDGFQVEMSGEFIMPRCHFCERRFTLEADERGRGECSRCLRARMARLRVQYSEEFGIPAEDVTVKVEARKRIKRELTRHVLRYWLPDGRMGYCDPIAAAATMSLPDYVPHDFII